MPYILDTEGDYTKKCETEACHNVILIGVSRTHCIECLEITLGEIELKFKPIPYFVQTRPM